MGDRPDLSKIGTPACKAAANNATSLGEKLTATLLGSKNTASVLGTFNQAQEAAKAACGGIDVSCLRILEGDATARALIPTIPTNQFVENCKKTGSSQPKPPKM